MLTKLSFRDLLVEECDRISEIDPSQYIEKVWRYLDREYQLISIDYMEEDWPDGYEKYRDGLKETILAGGVAIGAFDKEERLVGFVTLNSSLFGESAKYVLLDSMFVSNQFRNYGIGKHLFQKCTEKAKEWGAEKLYLCAASSQETIAFYRSLGCVDAKEVNKKLYESDPRDIQLEYELI
ncbi:GNAT family N-acetyltransferase [Aquibacillus halophilus]|uniref:GNAT family N-acetyltransferase n=2 Tax=Aquibacillus halophilus TaxID=930132 RepID=A0A6A8D732_9BACI|nr:GNAT family N-acetyltransferase [Aquibacillus halophilus]